MKLKIDGKAGLTLICYYVGDGILENGNTGILLNEKCERNFNTFPLEYRLRSIDKSKNSCVFGTFNCNRTLS